MNNPHSLSEKEFEIINILADGFRSNQRVLSNHIGLSLGMTNLLLRRLVTKGFLRIKQLDQKKVEYLLTPHGLSEKVKKSYLYTTKTIQSFGLIKSEINAILQLHLRSDIRKIHVVGKGDLADLVVLLLQQQLAGIPEVISSQEISSELSTDVLVLDASIESPASDLNRGIHLLTVLANSIKPQSSIMKEPVLVR